MDAIVPILQSIAATAIVAVAVFFARKYYALTAELRNCRSTNRRMLDSGIVEMFFARHQYASSNAPERTNILLYLATAQVRVRYIGLWMAQASEQYRLDEVVRNLLERGCDVEFVVLNPDMSPKSLTAAADALGMPENEIRTRASLSLEKLKELGSSLRSDLLARFRLFVHDVPLTASVIEFDRNTKEHRCWLDIKLRGRGRADSLSMEIKEGKDNLLLRVSASFDEVILRSKQVSIASKDSRALPSSGQAAATTVFDPLEFQPEVQTTRTEGISPPTSQNNTGG